MSYQPNKLVDGKLVHEDDYYKSPWGFWDYLDTFLFSLYFCAVILFLGSLIKEQNMFSEEVKTIAQKIGQFYLEKNDSDYAKAHDEIRGLGITSIEVEGEIVTIRANRIGYLIGNKGKNINNLIAYLDKKIKLVEEKESLLDYLLPWRS